MTEFDFETTGIRNQLTELKEERRNWTGGPTYYVGTAVEYAVYLEFGTSRMDPKPFFRPALAAYRTNLRAAIAADTETTLEEIDSVDELVETIAFGLERRVKRIITEKGLIDTGALRASVQAVRSKAELKTRGDVAAQADVDLDPAEFQEAAT